MSAAMNRAQANYDAMLPPDDSAREAEMERLADELETSYRLDVEILSDAFGDVSGTVGEYDKRYPNDPRAAQFLVAAFNGTDDAACMRLIRQVMGEYIRQRAEMDAEAKVWP